MPLDKATKKKVEKLSMFGWAGQRNPLANSVKVGEEMTQNYKMLPLDVTVSFLKSKYYTLDLY